MLRVVLCMMSIPSIRCPLPSKAQRNGQNSISFASKGHNHNLPKYILLPVKSIGIDYVFNVMASQSEIAKINFCSTLMEY